MDGKKIVLFTVSALLVVFMGLKVSWLFDDRSPKAPSAETENLKTIQDRVSHGETLLAIFMKHGLNMDDLYAIRDAAAKVYPLRMIHAGQPYKAKIEEQNHVNCFIYQINHDSILKIEKTATHFEARKEDIPYEKRLLALSGEIEDNLISAIGQDREHVMLALQLSDIFAWNIDFSVDLRKNDAYRVITEGLYLDGEFKRYGNIVAAEFVNDGQLFKAYRFEREGKIDYYDEAGKSLRRAFLKAPLNFRRISSHFSRGRLHPILKIRRPHNGIDYAAAAGTPVSALGDGKVVYAGWRGQYGRLIIIRHPNGWKTYYGHLSRISPEAKRGSSVKQGQLIGNVGSSGLSTGPHLHFELRINDRAVDPLKVKIPEGWPIPATEMAAFTDFRNHMDSCFSNPQNLRKYAAQSEKTRNVRGGQI